MHVMQFGHLQNLTRSSIAGACQMVKPRRMRPSQGAQTAPDHSGFRRARTDRTSIPGMGEVAQHDGTDKP
jgi:hypothetical protein